MKHLLIVALLGIALIGGCKKDENPTTTPTPQPDPIVGNWKSEGNLQVAPGLWGAPFKVRKIVATFNSNNTYTVTSTDSAGATVNYTGTFATTAANAQNIRGITLNQSTPTSVTSQGIYRVANDSLKYEIIQTTPAIPGFTAPVADSGFGSTKYNGVRLGAIWIQTFITQANTDVTVSSVTPTQAGAGAVVTITGTNFGSDKAAVAVQFSSAAATIDTIIGGTQIKTRVPSAAPEGGLVITVTKAGKNATAQFTVLNAIMANWKSEGQNQIAPGLWGPPFKVRRITATFNSNSTYAVTSTDSAGASINYTGTFSKTGPNSANIFAITANQATPTTVTSTGIYRVLADTLTYEIIQTTPAIPGFTPAHPDSGFGSTKYNNVRLGATWIQKFIRQP